MKKMFRYLVPVALLALTLVMAGCGDETTTSQAAPNNEFSKSGTYQGALMDAVTGKRIADPKVKIVMVRGADTVTVSRYVSDATDIVAGEFAFTGVPIAATGGDITYRVVVVAPGYQRFEAEVPATIAGINGNTIDSIYNFIANIYLFPEGATAADYTVKVRYNGTAVPGATVQLIQNMNSALTAQVGANVPDNRLNPSNGLLPVLTATADANGNAVFAGTSLVLGGSYTPVVLPAVNGGLQLATKFGNTFNEGVAGTSGVSQTITPQLAALAANTSGLYIASVDNTNTSGVLRSTGVLTITFSRAVELSNSATANVTTGAAAPFTGDVIFGYFATLSGNPSTAGLTASINLPALDSVANASIKPVAAVLSADGLTLTLTPNLKTLSAATDFDLAVAYSAGVAAAGISYVEPTINIKGAPEAKFTLFGAAGSTQLTKADGTTINAIANPKVNMIGPRP